MKKFNRRHVVITVERTENVTRFLQDLHKASINLSHVRVQAETLQFAVERRHLTTIRKGRRKYRLKLHMNYAMPEKILQKDLSTVLGLVLLIALPLILMQFIWKIEIEAPTIEQADQVEQYLMDELKIKAPMSKNKLITDYLLRQEIMQNNREFSWVHITKQGSHLIISPQLAPVNEVKNRSTKPHHLIASNSGVITHFNLQSGERKVERNMTVYKGDTLVSGVLERGEEHFVIGAVGEVYADYWLESTFTVPREISYNTLVERGWVLQWDWSQLVVAFQQQSFQPLLRIVESVAYQKLEHVTKVLEEEQVDTFILPLLHEKMLQSLPLKSTIKKENLLHVTIDDDTVKGKVLFLVNENIATPYPIYQGE